MWEGGLMSQLDAVDTPGTVEVHAEDFVRTGTADFVLNWAKAR
jgi:hypothetical protein